MAKRLPRHLSRKCALVLLPPSSITAPIEAVRRVHDKHFERWPPHINLLYPFLKAPCSLSEDQGGEQDAIINDDIRIRIQHAIKDITPFRISLNADTPGSFKHNQRRYTVWLGPTTQSVQHLQASLQAEFTDCYSDSRPFVPHLSVGQSRSEGGVESLQGEIRESVRNQLADREENTDIALHWHVDKVFVIERKDFYDRFKVVGAIALGEQTEWR